MSLVNWRRRQDRIDEVFVPESALAEGVDPRELPSFISFCVKHALDTAMYRREELPREALIASTLGDYLNEVDNGGHAQFIGNICWCEEHRSDIREGLAILGVEEAARVFADLEAFAKRTPKRFASYRRPWKERDPYFDELDRRLWGPVEESIDAALPAWIKTQPWLRTLPNEEYSRIPGWQTPHHTLREERLEERRRAREPELRRGLLALRAGLRARDTTGWRRLMWRILRAWYGRGL